MSVEEEVRAANAAFYRAFRDRDLTAMDALWAREAPVACMHPGMDVHVGRPAVMESWRGILAHPQAPRIECSRIRVHLLAGVAFITCLEGEKGQSPTLIATNLFVYENGRWLLVHHQAGPISPSQTPRHSRKPDPKILN